MIQQQRVLNGELIYKSYRDLFSLAPAWEKIGEMQQMHFNQMAHLLCEWMSLCVCCGRQTHCHEVASMSFCGDCIGPQEERIGEKATCAEAQRLELRITTITELLRTWREEGDEQEQQETWEMLKRALEEQ